MPLSRHFYKKNGWLKYRDIIKLWKNKVRIFCLQQLYIDCSCNILCSNVFQITFVCYSCKNLVSETLLLINDVFTVVVLTYLFTSAKKVMFLSRIVYHHLMLYL